MSQVTSTACDEDASNAVESGARDFTAQLSTHPQGSENEGLEENNQRLFFTRRDPKRVRILKALRMIPRSPSSVTYAQLGVQADLPLHSVLEFDNLRKELDEALKTLSDHFQRLGDNKIVISNLESDIQSLNTQIQDVQRSLEEKEQANTDLTQRLYRSEQELEILKHDHLAAALQMTEHKVQLTQSEIQLHHTEKENQTLQSQVEDLKLLVERLELDVAFLAEEKGDLEISLTEHKSFLDIVSKEKDESVSKEDELKNIVLQTRIESAEQIGKYIDELNAAHEEKRKFLNKKLAGSSKDLQKVLSKTDNYLLLKEEKNRLVDQVELMSTQAVFQDLLLEKYHGQIFRLAKLIQDDQNHKGGERTLLKDELNQALELISKKPKTETFNLKKSPKKMKYVPEPRNCSSLPGSPLQSTKHLRNSEPHLSRHSLKDHSETSKQRKSPGKRKSETKKKTHREKGNDPSSNEEFHSSRASSEDILEGTPQSTGKAERRPWSTDAWKRVVPRTPTKTSPSKRHILQ